MLHILWYSFAFLTSHQVAKCNVLHEATRCYKLGQLYSQLDGRCHFPLTQGPCQPGQWIVIDKTAVTGVCKRKTCTDLEQVEIGGSCVSLFDPDACKDLGKRLYYNAFGTGVCACEEGWFENGDKCYQEFTEGWCDGGKVLRRVNALEMEKNCRTLKDNESCVFPFYFNGNNYTRCTRDGDPENRPWCSTNVGIINDRVLGEEWGHCGQECLDRDEDINPWDRLICTHNVCGDDPKHSLPWKDGKCHHVEEELTNCAVEVGFNNKLVCRKISKNQTSFTETLISFRSVAFKPVPRKCKRGHIWSGRKRRCVRNIFFG